MSLIIVALLTHLLSIIIWGIIWLCIGNILIFFSFPSSKKDISISIYYLFFIIYFLFSSICNYLYVSDPYVDFFYAKDSLHFFEYTNAIGNLKSINKIITFSLNDFTCHEWKGFAIISGIVAYITNNIDYNNILCQKMIVVFFAAMILPFLYNILIYYFNNKISVTLTLVYGLCSYMLFYSGVYVRDMPINFFFIILFYLFYNNYSIFKIPLFLLINFCIYLLRAEHGIFSISVTAAYMFVYAIETNNRYKYLFLIPMVIIGIGYIISEYTFFFKIIDATTSSYLDSTLVDSSSSSLGIALLKLPWGIKQLSAGLFSQIIPFPFYIVLTSIGFLPLSLASLFWFFIWVLIFIMILNRKNWRYIEPKLWILFFIAFILVLGNYVNVDTRRIMAVYPIFFILGMKTFFLYSRKGRQKLVLSAAILYSLCLFLYYFIK